MGFLKVSEINSGVTLCDSRDEDELSIALAGWIDAEMVNRPKVDPGPSPPLRTQEEQDAFEWETYVNFDRHADDGWSEGDESEDDDGPDAA